MLDKLVSSAARGCIGSEILLNGLSAVTDVGSVVEVLLKFCYSLGILLCKLGVDLIEPNRRVLRFSSLLMVWLDNLLLPYILSLLN